MRERAQHVAAELQLTLKELNALSQQCLGLHINNVNMLLGKEHVRVLRATVSASRLAADRSQQDPHAAQ
jgi:hypothetical protein